MSHLNKSKSAKNLVGSCQSPAINYDKDFSAFDSSLIPENSKKAVEKINHFKSKDTLGLKTPDWNTSTYVDKANNLSFKMTPTKLKFELRAGFLGFSIPKYSQNKIYQGTDSRNDYSSWNGSTVVEKKDLRKKLEKLTETAFSNTKKSRENIGKDYMTPSQSQTQLVNIFRKEKEDFKEIRDKIKLDYLRENPYSSKEKTSAEIFKKISEHKIKLKQDENSAKIGGEEMFKPDLSLTLKRTVKKVRFHDGAWSVDKEDNKGFWSCCRSEEYNSPGCNLKIKDKNKMFSLE